MVTKSPKEGVAITEPHPARTTVVTVAVVSGKDDPIGRVVVYLAV